MDEAEIPGKVPEMSGETTEILGNATELFGKVEEMSGNVEETSGNVEETSGEVVERLSVVPETPWSGMPTGQRVKDRRKKPECRNLFLPYAHLTLSP